MQSILEQISGGDFSPLENFEPSADLRKAQNEAFEKFRTYTAGFGAEQTHELETIVEAHLEYMEIKEQEAYITGFRHGACIILEILQK